MTPKEINTCLDGLKNEYLILSEKYNLVDFSKLNEIFDIEDIDTETDFLLRKIRRVIADRIANYLRFVELILSPSNAPMFFFKLVQKLEDTDKTILNEIYEKLGNFEIEIIALDLNYSEKDEAEAIIKMHEVFSEIKENLLMIIKKLSNGVDKKRDLNRSYFG
jgi:hypothetical protein